MNIAVFFKKKHPGWQHLLQAAGQARGRDSPERDHGIEDEEDARAPRSGYWTKEKQGFA